MSSASISAEQAACAWECAHSLARSQLDYRRARLDIAGRSQTVTACRIDARIGNQLLRRAARPPDEAGGA